MRTTFERRTNNDKPTHLVRTTAFRRKCACGQHVPSNGGECEQCKKHHGMQQHAAMNNLPIYGGLSFDYRDLHSLTQPLDLAVPMFMKPHNDQNFTRISIQAKLTLNTPGDKYEQEADWAAERIMQIARPETLYEPSISQSREYSQIRRSRLGEYGMQWESGREQIPIMAKGLRGGGCESVVSEEREDEEEENTIMPKLRNRSTHLPSQSFEKQLSLTRGNGNPLSDKTRSYMESGFAHNFSSVRVHTDGQASFMAEQLNAEAFTSGQDIYFREGRYDPESFAGKRLLAHELTHVIQQGVNFSTQSTTANSSRGHNHIQRFTLKGFPPTEEAAMKAAVPVAISKVRSCSKLGWYGRFEIPPALNKMRYEYAPDLGYCGWTFPFAAYVEVGKEAFDPNTCCDLPSTLAHEAAHTVLYTEAKARKMECNCFGCSC